MSALLETTNAPARVAARASLTEVYYTICPVLNAANVAVELGWLDEEFKKVGARAIYLRSLKDNAGWIPHYTHSLPNLFRDGGSIPTIQAKADLTDTKLIGLTATQSGGQIVVRTDSGFHRVADLKGKRFGLFKSLNKEKIDFARASAEYGIIQALAVSGLKRSEVEIVDLEEADEPVFQPASKPSELWSQNASRRLLGGKDVEALKERRVEAIYSHAARSVSLVASGEFKVIEDLNRYPDWTLRVANGPLTAAVNTEFAEKHPEVVVAYLRAAIRAGHWINAHREAAAEIFQRVTFSPNPKWIARTIAEFDFVPNLSAQNLVATEIEKNFLIDHGYVKNDFDVRKWADASFLETAHKDLVGVSRT
jgi:ABC-type nitrate/sulfonate/bicarbonate transport system substrate-binding protein